MARLREIHQVLNLEDYATEDGFEFVGDGLVLFFVTGRGTKVRRDFVLCSSVREAKREVKGRRAAGWKCCWKVFGQVHLPGEADASGSGVDPRQNA